MFALPQLPKFKMQRYYFVVWGWSLWEVISSQEQMQNEWDSSLLKTIELTSTFYSVKTAGEPGRVLTGDWSSWLLSSASGCGTGRSEFLCLKQPIYAPLCGPPRPKTQILSCVKYWLTSLPQFLLLFLHKSCFWQNVIQPPYVYS